MPVPARMLDEFDSWSIGGRSGLHALLARGLVNLSKFGARGVRAHSQVSIRLPVERRCVNATFADDTVATSIAEGRCT